MTLYLPLHKSLTNNGWLRILLALTTFTSIACAFGVLAFVCRVHLPVSISSTVYLVLLFVLSLLISKKFKRAKISFLPHLYLLFPALIILAFFGINMFIGPGLSHSLSQISLFQSITKAEDDAGNHLMIFSHYFINNNSSTTGHYTFGTEWATSLIANSIIPSIANPAATLMIDLYIVFKLLLFGFAALALTIFITELFKKVINSELGIFDKVFLVFAGLVLSVFIIAPLYRNGFFSFIPIIGYISLLCALLLNVCNKKSRLYVVLYGCVIATAVSTSWFIPVPVIYLTLLIIALPILRKNWGSIVPMTTFSVLTTLCVLYCLFTAPETSSAADMLTLWGGYPALDRIFTYSIIVLSILFIIHQKFILKNNQVSQILIYLTVAITFILSLCLFFYIKQGMLSYYYYKIETTALCILIPVVFIFITSFLYARQKELAIFSFVIFFALFMTYYLDNKLNDYRLYITQVNNTAATVEPRVMKLVLEKMSHPIHDQTHNTCSIYINEIYQQTVNSTNLGNNPTNLIMNNKCMVDGYLNMFNSDKIDYQVFVQKAKQNGIKYELWFDEETKAKIVNISDDENVLLREY